MTDQDKLFKAGESFYRHLENIQKESPDLKIDIPYIAHDYAMLCGFDSPRCFVKYIEDLEYERSKNSTQ